MSEIRLKNPFWVKFNRQTVLDEIRLKFYFSVKCDWQIMIRLTNQWNFNEKLMNNQYWVKSKFCICILMYFSLILGSLRSVRNCLMILLRFKASSLDIWLQTYTRSSRFNQLNLQWLITCFSCKQANHVQFWHMS